MSWISSHTSHQPLICLQWYPLPIFSFSDAIWIEDLLFFFLAVEVDWPKMLNAATEIYFFSFINFFTHSSHQNLYWLWIFNKTLKCVSMSSFFFSLKEPYYWNPHFFTFVDFTLNSNSLFLHWSRQFLYFHKFSNIKFPLFVKHSPNSSLSMVLALEIWLVENDTHDTFCSCRFPYLFFLRAQPTFLSSHFQTTILCF